MLKFGRISALALEDDALDLFDLTAATVKHIRTVFTSPSRATVPLTEFCETPKIKQPPINRFAKQHAWDSNRELPAG